MDPADRIYRELQRHLDKSPSGFAAAKSGADIRLLKHLLTLEEAEIAAHLSVVKAEPISRIHERLKKAGVYLPVDELGQTLERMERKGTLLGYEKPNEEKRYKNAGVSAGGMIDFQVNRLTPELIDDVDRYHEDSFASLKKPRGQRVPPLRTIPVEKSLPLPDRRTVRTYDDVRQVVLKSPGPFSVANCICRQMKDMRGQKCKHTELRETCIQIGPEHARRYVAMGIGRYISREEVFEILDKALEAGLILQPENSQKPDNICCCCGDCCGPLQAAAKSPRPADMYATDFIVGVDHGLCTGCGICVERCQLAARVLIDGKSIFNIDRCIGCGNCVVSCPSGASRLSLKQGTRVPPTDKDAAMMKMMASKTSRLGMLRLRLRVAFGRRV